MNKRTLGKAAIEVSEIGLGAWQIGADWGDVISEAQAREALAAAADAGVSFIDTADVYGDGRSEEIVGRFVADRSERIHVATKMGRATEEWNDSYDQITRAAEASCQRLGVDVLDLVQLHCIPEQTLKAGKAFENLEKIKDVGLIRHYGASVETIDEGLFCIRNSDAVSLQVIFNILRQRLIDELLPAARAAEVGIIARVPLASGLLSGRFATGHQFHEHDHRHFNCDGQRFNVGETFAGVPFETGVVLVKEIDGILADELAASTLAQKALRWILDHDGVTTVIPGARNAEQARQNAAVSDMPPLSSESHSQLRELYREQIDAAVRGRY